MLFILNIGCINPDSLMCVLHAKGCKSWNIHRICELFWNLCGLCGLAQWSQPKIQNRNCSLKCCCFMMWRTYSEIFKGDCLCHIELFALWHWQVGTFGEKRGKVKKGYRNIFFFPSFFSFFLVTRSHTKIMVIFSLNQKYLNLKDKNWVINHNPLHDAILLTVVVILSENQDKRRKWQRQEDQWPSRCSAVTHLALASKYPQKNCEKYECLYPPAKLRGQSATHNTNSLFSLKVEQVPVSNENLPACAHCYQTTAQFIILAYYFRLLLCISVRKANSTLTVYLTSSSQPTNYSVFKGAARIV